MEQSTGRTYGIRSCIIDGCRNDVVCIEVHVRYRREPIHEIHSTICATHAVGEGLRVAFDCDRHPFDREFQELAQVDMVPTCIHDINCSYQ